MPVPSVNSICSGGRWHGSQEGGTCPCAQLREEFWLMLARLGGMPVVGSSSVRLHLSVHLLVHCNTFRVCLYSFYTNLQSLQCIQYEDDGSIYSIKLLITLTLSFLSFLTCFPLQKKQDQDQFT